MGGGDETHKRISAHAGRVHGQDMKGMGMLGVETMLAIQDSGQGGVLVASERRGTAIDEKDGACTWCALLCALKTNCRYCAVGVRGQAGVSEIRQIF